jgi:hypothetical protein
MVNADGPPRIREERAQARIARAEEEVDRAEVQLGQMRAVRRAVLTRALPFVALILVAVFGSAGWGIGDPIPVSIASILLGGVAAFGVLSHLGVRRAEERIDLLTEDLALEIGRVERARSEDS